MPYRCRAVVVVPRYRVPRYRCAVRCRAVVRVSGISGVGLCCAVSRAVLSAVPSSCRRRAIAPGSVCRGCGAPVARVPVPRYRYRYRAVVSSCGYRLSGAGIRCCRRRGTRGLRFNFFCAGFAGALVTACFCALSGCRYRVCLCPSYRVPYMLCKVCPMHAEPTSAKRANPRAE